eukprot:12915242-Prorocentrum_lima.AAC.1
MEDSPRSCAQEGKCIKAWVPHTQLMSVTCLAGRRLIDIHHDMQLPELKFDEPQRRINVMRSFDVLHECGADH